MSVDKELIDRLLVDYEKPEDIIELPEFGLLIVPKVPNVPRFEDNEKAACVA